MDVGQALLYGHSGSRIHCPLRPQPHSPPTLLRLLPLLLWTVTTVTTDWLVVAPRLSWQPRHSLCWTFDTYPVGPSAERLFVRFILRLRLMPVMAFIRIRYVVTTDCGWTMDTLCGFVPSRTLQRLRTLRFTFTGWLPHTRRGYGSRTLHTIFISLGYRLFLRILVTFPGCG